MLKPIADRVLVLPDKAADRTKGGLIIPENAKEAPQQGTVIAVGGGKDNIPLVVKEGDKIMYGKFAGTEIIYGEEETKYKIMRESDIVAILD